MTICKWCRRMESEHDPQHGDYRCVIKDDWVEDTSPSSSLLYLTFTPDLTPTGKLIAAALEAADFSTNCGGAGVEVEEFLRALRKGPLSDIEQKLWDFYDGRIRDLIEKFKSRTAGMVSSRGGRP